MKRFLPLALLILTLSVIFCSCDKKGNEPEKSSETPSSEEKVDGIVLSGENRYRIIFPRNNPQLKQYALTIYDKLLSLDAEANLKPAYYTLTSDSVAEGNYSEILIGLTDRAASADAKSKLKNYSDFSISVSEGKIAIYAETPKRIEDAIKYFVSKIAVTDGGTVYCPKDIECVSEYAGDFPTASLCGTSLKEYTVVIPENASEVEKAIATELCNSLAFTCGKSLPLIKDSDGESSHEILIGLTSRQSADAASSVNDRIVFENGKIALLPSSDSGYARLVEHLKNRIETLDGTLTENDVKFASMSCETIKSITFGAVSIKEVNGGLQFNKCTDFQIQEWTKLGRANESSGSTGIRLDFTSNTSHLYFKSANGNKYDLLINGEYAESTTNGVFDKDFGNTNDKRITILFNNHQVNAAVSEIYVDENATVTPHVYDRKFLILGDSITQGYLAQTDCNSWANRISRMFNADSVNQGISGGWFQASSIDQNLDFKPDCIFVAYGTNDWYWGSKALDGFKNDAKAFYEKLRLLYPEATIIGITPIWRGNSDATDKFCSFEQMSSELADIIKSVEGIAID